MLFLFSNTKKQLQKRVWNQFRRDYRVFVIDSLGLKHIYLRFKMKTLVLRIISNIACRSVTRVQTELGNA